jgi:hypothetical protein
MEREHILQVFGQLALRRRCESCRGGERCDRGVRARHRSGGSLDVRPGLVRSSVYILGSMETCFKCGISLDQATSDASKCAVSAPCCLYIYF